MATSETPHKPRPIRCAIYTRKSTEEGLEQDFNSLDAQRDASEAFILSQRREGWSTLSDRYDDGGFTGANMDRPALTRLLAAVEAGELDCVVVYKVDRLSRSLLDFTHMLSLFEKHHVSFVAVTQQFNTSTSLGRLTLNILLSFAQFERELVGERTRDKMSAARRRGKWVGGHPVLGYDLAAGGKKLIVNHEEAERVRNIFDLFEKDGSLRTTLNEIERRGWKLKSWTRPSGVPHAGASFSRNSPRRLLSNTLYTGRIRHKGQLYPGEHPAIIDAAVWDRTQGLMKKRPHPAPVRNKHQALLTGLLFCHSCQARMIYAYTGNTGRRYPYYVCLNAQRRGWAACPAKALPARAVEETVLNRIREEEDNPLLRGTAWETADRARQIEVLHQVIERIAFDGAGQRLCIRLRPAREAGGEQCRA